MAETSLQRLKEPREKRPRRPERDDREVMPTLRTMADQAFSRAAGAPLIGGNSVRLLVDAAEVYPRWHEAIRAAKDHVHFESYFITEDNAGRALSEVLCAKAREGVRVRVLHDWLGTFTRTSRKFWRTMREAGVETRAYNPPRLSSPLAIFSRDHRKTVAIDNEIAFVTGLCVSDAWVGDPARKREPWRDTGVEIRGCAVAEIERAFARLWAMTGDPLPGGDAIPTPPAAGDVNLRIVSTEPATAGMLRLDQMIAALARQRLWLTDPYYAGTTAYVQALRAAAKDGVDNRLLVPNATDIPLLQPLSRAGYRPLLEAGVRVFEWKGSMIHAKTGVADGRWARVGSTNLNISSWLGNCELDAVIEDEGFARQMEELYLRDLENATEVVLDGRRKLRAPGAPRHLRGGGSARRGAAGAVRIGNAIGAAMTDHRALGPVEARLATLAGLVLTGLAVLVAFFPYVLAYPAALAALWGGLAMLWRGVQLRRAQKQRLVGAATSTPTAPTAPPAPSEEPR